MKFEYDEQIIQIAVGTGGDNRPFLMTLTNKGRVFSSAIHGQGDWEETKLPEKEDIYGEDVQF